MEVSTERNKLEDERWDVKTIIKWAYRSLASRLKPNYSDSVRDECWGVVEIVMSFGISYRLGNLGYCLSKGPSPSKGSDEFC